MGTNPRDNKHNLTRLTISGGKGAEPRLVLVGHSKPDRSRWVAVAVGILAVIAIVLAGSSS